MVKKPRDHKAEYQKYKEYRKEYYLKNKDKLLKEKKEKYHAVYKFDKVYMQKQVKITDRCRRRNPERYREVKQRAYTGMKYPITNQICDICKISPATEHHHHIKPYHYDKFQYICRDCHTIIHTKFKKSKGE